MKEILSSIAKSLESIATEFKARNSYREEMKQKMEQMETLLKDIQDDPFGMMKKPK